MKLVFWRSYETVPLLPATAQLTPPSVCENAGKSKLAMSVHWALTGQVDERPVMDGRVGDVAFDVTAASDILGPASDIVGVEEEGEGGRKKRKARAKKTDQGTEVGPPLCENYPRLQAPNELLWFDLSRSTTLSFFLTSEIWLTRGAGSCGVRRGGGAGQGQRTSL